MTAPKHIPARSTRDRLIELLGLGETYPLQDVVVEENQLTVNFRTGATIGIDPGQKDVRYELYDEKVDEPVGYDCHIDGSGEETLLPGPVITHDRTFRIRAFKLRSPDRATFLEKKATVKVGLNKALTADLPELPFLHDFANSPYTNPWIADHGAIVRVRVEDSQAEASYWLVYAVPGAEIHTDPVPSAGGDLLLSTKPVEEDTRIRIHAKRTSGPGDTAVLDAELPLAVRADPSRTVSIPGSALVDPAAPATTTITVAGSQRSADYSVHVRSLRDDDFDFDPSALLDAPFPFSSLGSVLVHASLDVPEHHVDVRPPARPMPSWKTQDGYVVQGEAIAGNGANLQLSVGPLVEDSVIVIQAHKRHFADPSAGGVLVRSGESAVQLEQAAVAFARPGPAAGLTLTVSPNADGETGTLLVSGGQPGVFYHFRRGAAPAEIGAPAYFHRLDQQDPQQNRGVGQLVIGKDFVVARDPPQDPASPPRDPALTRPLDPLVDIASLPLDGTLTVNAVRARTGVGWSSTRSFPVSVKPTP